jgi:uncharacterized protein YprB with RNaseH-like and TPR domain
MLEHTFVHIPGIGKATELGLWGQGVHTWADADGLDPGSRTVRPRALAQLRRYLPPSHRAVEEKDAAFFARLCGLGEAWRLFSRFAQDCVYLDIETTGLSPGADDITVEYNRADVVHLKTILEICYARLAAETRRPLDTPPRVPMSSPTTEGCSSSPPRGGILVRTWAPHREAFAFRN